LAQSQPIAARNMLHSEAKLFLQKTGQILRSERHNRLARYPLSMRKWKDFHCWFRPTAKEKTRDQGSGVSFIKISAAEAAHVESSSSGA